MLRLLRYALPLIAITAVPALACGFHTYTPKPSFVERLLGSDHIVLARQEDGNPFRFKAIEALEGSLDYVDIPDLVDSTTRRRLNAMPDASVLFARDEAYGPWKRLAFVDDEMGALLDRIAPRLSDWELGGDEERFALFAEYIGSENRSVRELALRELDQADYSLLETVATDIEVAPLVAGLRDTSQVDLWPIQILLLGLSGDRTASDFLKRGVARHSGIQGAMLGAYTTAYLELNGREGLDHIVTDYLANPEHPAGSREMITEALVLHSISGPAEFQIAVREQVTNALSADPALAPAVARQFGARGDWSQVQTLSELLKARALTSPVDILVVSQYIAIAGDFQDTGSN